VRRKTIGEFKPIVQFSGQPTPPGFAAAPLPRCPAAPGKPPSRMLLAAAPGSAVATAAGAFWFAVPDSYSEA